MTIVYVLEYRQKLFPKGLGGLKEARWKAEQEIPEHQMRTLPFDVYVTATRPDIHCESVKMYIDGNLMDYDLKPV